MKKIYLIILLVEVFCLQGYSQTVTNINTRLSGNNIIINYTIVGAKFYQKFDVSLFVSLDDGKTWQGPLQKVSGDVGGTLIWVRKALSGMFWRKCQ